MEFLHVNDSQIEMSSIVLRVGVDGSEERVLSRCHVL
jgi:hypothetical protein